MNIRRVDAGKGMAWYGDGWRLFTTDPGLWVVITLLFGIIVVAIGVVPVVGTLAMSLLAPSLAGGLFHAARESHEGHKIDVNQLFVVFTLPEKREAMLVLGVVFLAANFLMLLTSMVAVGGTLGMMGMLGGMGQGHQQAAAMGTGVGILLALLVIALILLVLAMGLVYAVPLVMFTDSKPLAAIKSSIRACAINFMPLLVFSVIYMALSFIAALPALLGYLLLGPVTVGALYASYRDVYEQPENGN